MAAGAPSADRPQVSQREVAASLSSSAIGGVDQKTIDFAQKLQAEKAKAGGKSAAFEAAKIDLENKSKKWAGGRGEEAKEAFRDDKIKKEVGNKIEAINKLKQGLELANLDPSRRTTRIKEMKDLGLVDKKADADTLISEACATIANSKMFDVLYPDLAGLTPGQKQIWVESGLALNPVLGDKISTLMSAWQEGVNEFTVISTTQTEQQKIDVAAAQAKQQKAHDNIDSIITNTLLIKKINPIPRAALDTAMESGDKSAILNVLVDLKGIKPLELKVINDFNENKQLLYDYRTKKVTVSKEELSRVEKLVEGPPPPVVPKMDIFDTIVATVDSAVFSSNLTAYQEQTEVIDNALLQKSPKNDQEQLNLLNRKGQEQSSLSDLENIIDRAMMQTYDVIEADLIDSKIAVEKQQIIDATKDGRLDEAQMLTARGKRWIEKLGSGHPEKVHLEQIRQDLNIIRQYGKVGIHLLMARDAGIIKPADFNLVLAGQESANLVIAKLDAKNFERLDQLIKKDGMVGDYRDSLMLSYIRARRYLKQGVIGRFISHGKMIEIDRKGGPSGKDWDDFFATKRFELSENEMEDLHIKFGEEIENAVTQNSEAKAFVDRMRSKGIMSDTKLKMFIYMLMMMGLFAIPGAGVAGIATAGATLAGASGAGALASGGVGLAGTMAAGGVFGNKQAQSLVE